MPELHTLMTGIAFGESPRWHAGRLWFADWGTQEVSSRAQAAQRWRSRYIKLLAKSASWGANCTASRRSSSAILRRASTAAGSC